MSLLMYLINILLYLFSLKRQEICMHKAYLSKNYSIGMQNNNIQQSNYANIFIEKDRFFEL